jgi:branched-chain amino acid transport system ATP-binding protein
MAQGLRVDALTVGYDDGPPIVNDVTVAISPGKVAVILGPNGAGKSTLAKAIVGLLPVSDGHVYVDDDEITGTPPFRLARLGVGYLPQLDFVFDDMTVLENLQMGAYTLRDSLKERTAEVLDLFPDLADVLARKAGQLSGGQQRMVGLARVLMVHPRLAIFDEPTAGLAPRYVERVWEQIDRIRSKGLGLLVIEQNAKTALEHADEVFVLAEGRNVISGPATRLAHEAAVAEALAGL